MLVLSAVASREWWISFMSRLLQHGRVATGPTDSTPTSRLDMPRDLCVAQHEAQSEPGCSTHRYYRHVSISLSGASLSTRKRDQTSMYLATRHTQLSWVRCYRTQILWTNIMTIEWLNRTMAREGEIPRYLAILDGPPVRLR